MRNLGHRLNVALVAASLAHLVSLAAPALAQAPEVAARPKVGLVLSGGGARGGAHVGVLKVLHELHIPVDVVVGTSAGAIVGGAYASGMPLSELEREIATMRTATLFNDVSRADLPVRHKADEYYNTIGPEVGIGPKGLALPKGVVAGVSLEALLRRLSARQRSERFDGLPIRFRAVATDLATAEMVVLDQGSLSTALRASMALPAIVNPVELDGRLLVDGGISRNLPVDVARAAGADVIIAVNIGTPLQRRDELTSILHVSDQISRILTGVNTSKSLGELTAQDVLITPDLAAISSADFDKVGEAEKAGEAAARAASEQLRRFSVAQGLFASAEQRRTRTVTESMKIDAVRVTGAHRVGVGRVRAALRLKVGDLFNPDTADGDLRRLYSSGEFESVNYFLSEQAGGGKVLTTDVGEKSWGPNFLRAGLGLSSDFNGDARFNLLLTHRLPGVNDLGGEWRNRLQVGRIDRIVSEFYQPFDVNDKWFGALQLEASREPFDLYAQGERIGRYQRSQSMAHADLGLNLGTDVELRVGVVRGHVRMRLDTGVLPEGAVEPGSAVAGATAHLRLDTLDSMRFPRNGYVAYLRYFHARAPEGQADGYGKLDVNLQAARAFGPHVFHAQFSNTRGTGRGPLPAYELSTLGGFLRLSGYRTGEFIGTNPRLGRLLYTYRAAMPGILDGVHFGASTEFGRINNILDSVPARGTLRSNALFMGADTPVGPLYLGYGRAAGGNNAFYLYLGLP